MRSFRWSFRARVLLFAGALMLLALLAILVGHWLPRRTTTAPTAPSIPVTNDRETTASRTGAADDRQGVGATALVIASNTTAAGIVVRCTVVRSSGTVTSRLYRSPTPHFAPPGQGTLVDTATTSGAATLTDARPLVGAANFYRVVVTDATGTTTTTQSAGELALQSNWRQPIVIGAIGDSLTVGIGADDPPTQGYVQRMAALLNQLDPFHLYTIENQGISGTKSTEWADVRTRHLAKAIAAMKAAGVSWVTVMLGSNDANNRFATPVDTYRASMATIVDALVAQGFRVYVSGPPAVRPTASPGPFDDLAVDRTMRYGHAVAALDNGVTVLVDADKLAERYQPYIDTLRDDVHPTSAGHQLIGQWKAIGILEANQRLAAHREDGAAAATRP